MQALDGLERRGADAGLLRLAERLEEGDALRVGVHLEAGDRRVADAAARPVGDARERDAVEGVVDHLEVGDRVLDLGALVEARAADHLVRDLLADEHVLQHARLRVRAVEDRDLGAGVALLDQAGDLGGDEARLGVLVLDLEHADRVALAELAEQVLRLALAVVERSASWRRGGWRSSSGSSARARSPARRRSRARTRGCCGCRRRGRRRSTGRGRRRRRRSRACRRAAGEAGTARGSCPGTRPRGRSGRPSATSRARPGGSPAPRRCA